MTRDSEYWEPFSDLPTSQAGEVILTLLSAMGCQPVIEIYREVRTQVVGIDASNYIEITNSAIAVLLSNGLLEKQEYEGDRDDQMIDYYDLPEED
jgi:hypothetical protein